MLFKVGSDSMKEASRFILHDNENQKLEACISDVKGKYVRRFSPWKTSKTVTIVVINKQGDIVGKFKHNQLPMLREAIDAALEE